MRKQIRFNDVQLKELELFMLKTKVNNISEAVHLAVQYALKYFWCGRWGVRLILLQYLGASSLLIIESGIAAVLVRIPSVLIYAQTKAVELLIIC